MSLESWDYSMSKMLGYPHLPTVCKSCANLGLKPKGKFSSQLLSVCKLNIDFDIVNEDCKHKVNRKLHVKLSYSNCKRNTPL